MKSTIHRLEWSLDVVGMKKMMTPVYYWIGRSFSIDYFADMDDYDDDDGGG
jgi:hypothetical protein